MESKCCHRLFSVGLQLSLDVGSVGGGHACFQSSCGLWWAAMLSSTRWCWQGPMYPPRWLQEGRVLSPDPVKMADWKLFSGRRPHRSSLRVKNNPVCRPIFSFTPLLHHHTVYHAGQRWLCWQGHPKPVIIYYICCPRPEAQTRSLQKLINKRLKVSFTSEWAHALCGDDTWTDCVICWCPSDPAAEMCLLSDSSSGCAWHCLKKARQSFLLKQ